jgi:hypothetical protein
MVEGGEALPHRPGPLNQPIFNAGLRALPQGAKAQARES